jgi:hypothetical protein
MSHFSTIKTELRDRAALEAALSDLGLRPGAGPRPVRGYRGQTVEAELAIPQANGADIGFRWNSQSGCYELVTDLELWSQPVPVERFLSRLFAPFWPPARRRGSRSASRTSATMVRSNWW